MKVAEKLDAEKISLKDFHGLLHGRPLKMRKNRKEALILEE